MTLELYAAYIINTIRRYPHGGSSCQTPKAFRLVAINPVDEAKAANFGAVPDEVKGRKPYFYSTAFERAGANGPMLATDYREFPAVFVTETSITERSSLASGSKIVEIQIDVIDRYEANNCGGDCSGCKGRSVREIERDTEAVLNFILQKLTEVDLWQDADKSILISRNDAVKGMAADAVQKPIGAAISNLNKDISFIRVSHNAAGLHGTGAVIRLPVESCVTAQLRTDIQDLDFNAAGCCQ